MHFHQQRAVCSQGRQGHVTELLAAVCCVLLQAWTVWGQGGHAMVMDPSAIWDVNLCHVLSPRGYFHQKIVIYLVEHRNTMWNINCEKFKRQKQYRENLNNTTNTALLTCWRPLRSICFQNWKSKQRSLQYLHTREAHRQRSFTVKCESTWKEGKEDIMHEDKSVQHVRSQCSKSNSTTA